VGYSLGARVIVSEIPTNARRQFVFISHASPDKKKIKPIVDALRHAGLQVWLDNPAEAGYSADDRLERIHAGRGSWRAEIRIALRQAACVLVCWSQHAIAGDVLSGRARVVWLSEIAVADHDETLISCLIDDIDPAKLPGAYSLDQCPRVGENIGEPQRSAAIKALVDDVKAKMEDVIRHAEASRQKPGYHPPPFEVVAPPDPVEGFVGRDDLLLKVDEILQSSRIAVIHGMGGMGKTSLAKEYVSQFGHRYDGIGWVPAETREGMMKGVAALGRAWGVTVKDDAGDDVIAQETLRRLGEQPGTYLFIYDNIDVPSRAQELRHAPNTHRLITSRKSDWRGIAKDVRIAELSVSEAITLLQHRADRVDEADAARLAEVLGRLPLALVHAGALCRLRTMSFSQYTAKVSLLIDEAPPRSSRDDPPHSVAATFELSIDALKEPKSGEAAAATAKRARSLDRLITLLAYCAPERIPTDLIEAADDDERQRAQALEELSAASLIRYDDFPDKSPGVSIHRLVQEVARRRAEADGSGRRAIGQLIDRLAALFPSEMRDETWPKAAKLMPHLLGVLLRVQEDEFRQRKERNLLDRLVSSVVFALLFATEEQRGEIAQRIDPDHLVRVLGRFYEVAPLSGALDMLLKHHRADWPRLQEQLLSANNYVLRFAMAKAVAKACRKGSRPPMQVKDIADLVDPEKDLNTFELGGYALNFIYADNYAKNPKIVDPKRLKTLANHPCYPGRSILGDMLLNLVFQGLKPRTLLASDRFWKPIWDYVALDVHVIDAAEPFLAGRELPSDASPGARDAYANLKEIDDRRRALLTALPPHADVAGGLLQDYFELGPSIEERIGTKRARDQIAALPDLGAFMGLLFAHPVWSVAETVASVLAELVRRKNAPISVVTDLFDDRVWRTRFGAIETSYQLREHDDMASFTTAVHRFHADASSKIRGLCAENLFAEIINLGGKKRARRIQEFEPEIRIWLKDEDCWVLEHIYRFFNALHKSRFDVRGLLSAGVSRLLDDKPEWYALGREEFLRHIEARKQKILSDKPIPSA
jgi:TIR domain/NB-ARC domain